MIRLSGEGTCATRPVVRSANCTGPLSTKPSSVAPPAIARVKNVTTASKTMLQFSSRILMPGKRGRRRGVPAKLVERRGCVQQRHPLNQTRQNFEMTISIEATSGHAFDDEGV